MTANKNRPLICNDCHVHVQIMFQAVLLPTNRLSGHLPHNRTLANGCQGLQNQHNSIVRLSSLSWNDGNRPDNSKSWHQP